MEVDLFQPLERPCHGNQASPVLEEGYVNIINDLLRAHAAMMGEGTSPFIVEGVIPVLANEGQPCELIVFLNAHPTLGVHKKCSSDVLLKIQDYLQDEWEAVGFHAPLLNVSQRMYPGAAHVSFLRNRHDLKMVGV